MEFIICNRNKEELGPMPSDTIIDFNIGDTNDVEVECARGMIDFGMWLICPGTEYGALIEEKDIWTNSVSEKWTGNSFRKFLENFIIEPPAGQDYRVVSGDAHDIMRSVLGSAFDSMFMIPDESSGINISTYQFDRYTNALAGFTKMLLQKNARINIEIVQGAPNEPFSVILSAVPIRNLSEEIEFSEDSKIAVNLKESRRGINHLICRGKGELKDQLVVHLYAQPDGTVAREKYYTGIYERAATYDYFNAEDEKDLVAKGAEQLKKSMNYKKMKVDIAGIELQIGDIVSGRSYDGGIKLQKPVVSKVVKIKKGDVLIDYKVSD